jgi:hypothetical protein
LVSGAIAEAGWQVNKREGYVVSCPLLFVVIAEFRFANRNGAMPFPYKVDKDLVKFYYSDNLVKAYIVNYGMGSNLMKNFLTGFTGLTGILLSSFSRGK